MSGFADSGYDPKYDWGSDYHDPNPDYKPNTLELLVRRCLLALIGLGLLGCLLGELSKDPWSVLRGILSVVAGYVGLWVVAICGLLAVAWCLDCWAGMGRASAQRGAKKRGGVRSKKGPGRKKVAA